MLTGQIHFPKNCIGKEMIMEDNQKFTIFRQVIIGSKSNRDKNPKASFRVRFKIANMTPKQNKRFSLIPIPFFIGLPGFRSKLWMLNENNGYFQGIYEWDTIQHAEKYAQSFAMKFMTKRAVPGSISYEIRSLKPSQRPSRLAKSKSR